MRSFTVILDDDVIAGTMSGPFAQDAEAMIGDHKTADVTLIGPRMLDPIFASIGSNLLQVRSAYKVDNCPHLANDPIPSASRIAPVARVVRCVAFVFLVRWHLDLSLPRPGRPVGVAFP